MTDVIEDLRARAEELLGHDIPEFQAQVLEHIARRDGISIAHAPVDLSRDAVQGYQGGNGGMRWHRNQAGTYVSPDGTLMIQKMAVREECHAAHYFHTGNSSAWCSGDASHLNYVWRLFRYQPLAEGNALKDVRAIVDLGASIGEHRG